MADFSFTPDERSTLFTGIQSGRSWQQIEATIPTHSLPEIKLMALRMKLVHNMPGPWPQIRDWEEDGAAVIVGDPLLDALFANHCESDVRNVIVPVGLPKKLDKPDTYSLVPSFASMAAER